MVPQPIAVLLVGGGTTNASPAAFNTPTPIIAASPNPSQSAASGEIAVLEAWLLVPPSVPVSASTCVDSVSPVAANATVKLLKRNNRAPDETAADALDVELTT